MDDLGNIVGVGIAGRPVSRMLDDGWTLEVLRVAVMDKIQNGSSMIYGRIIKIGRWMGYRYIITYTLNKESQITMKALGAVLESEVRVNPTGWDRKSRPRKNQDVYFEPKYRWRLWSDKNTDWTHPHPERNIEDIKENKELDMFL